MLDKNNITTMEKREILFRGWNKKNKKWIYGYYFAYRGYHFISPDDKVNPLDTYEDYVIDADTVGQYTGMKDAKGVKIFEGDILKFTVPDGSIRYFAVKWGTNERILMPLGGFEHDGNAVRISGWCFVWNGCPLYPTVIDGVADNEVMVVIGNVNENQELIKTKRYE